MRETMQSRSSGSTAHLNDDQFAELLLGTRTPAVSEHLAICPECAEEAQAVAGAIGSFEMESRLWAERRAATMPALAPQTGRAYGWFHPPAFAAAWMTAAAGAIFSASISLNHHFEQRAISGTAVVTTTESVPKPVPAATLKADNALLEAIDGELSETTSASAYGLDETDHSARGHHVKRGI